MSGLWRFLPKSVAQLAGVIVAGIVAFGTDMDTTMAVPLGMLAGALATFVIAFAEGEMALRTPQRAISRIKR